MRADLVSLNDTLFEMIERIHDDELKGQELNEQLIKAKAISDISTNIINNTKLMIDAAKLMASDDFADSNIVLPKQITNSIKNEPLRLTTKAQ